MVVKRSAGVLLHRPGAQGLEVLLVHPGGPFWLNKDVGAWQLPKGMVEAGEDDEAAARREAAEELGIRMGMHPDDPPRPLFGLPRIASTGEDYAALFEAVPSRANGMCFCTGSLGVRPDNDLPAIARRFAERIGFVHLRATKRTGDGRSFHEADHLAGDVDMVAVLRELVAEDAKRPAGRSILFRPDHGHRMLDDLNKTVSPGYPAIGRLKGLAELRGILYALGAPPV